MSFPSRACLAEAVMQVAAEAAYLFVEEAGTEAAWPETLLLARVEVTRPSPGQLVLASPLPWGSQLWAALVGRDVPGPETDALRGDALKEFLNIVSGIVVGDDSAPADSPGFGIPWIEFTGREELAALTAAAQPAVTFLAEPGSPLALLFLPGSAAPGTAQ